MRYKKLSILVLTSSLILAACSNEKEKVDTVEEIETKEVVELPLASDANLNSAVSTFLKTLAEKKDVAIQNVITGNFDKVTGTYAYPVEVLEIKDKSIKMDLGFSTVQVQESKVSGHQDFMESLTAIEKGDKGMAIVVYSDNVITEVDVYKMDYSREYVGEAIQGYIKERGAIVAEKPTDKEVKEEEKTFKNSTVEDWQGMALLTARDIASRKMAPVFLVPNSKDVPLTDTFYYIIVGEVVSTSEGKTSLKTYNGKTINLDFEVEMDKSDLNKTAWLHVITNNGVVESSVAQTFDEADLATVAEGVRGYINIAAITNK